MIDFTKIVYKDGGRDYPELDCWGLVLLIYKDRGLPCFIGTSYKSERVPAIEAMDASLVNIFEGCDWGECEVVMTYHVRGKYQGRPMHLFPVMGGSVYDITSGSVANVPVDDFKSLYVRPYTTHRIRDSL